MIDEFGICAYFYKLTLDWNEKQKLKKILLTNKKGSIKIEIENVEKGNLTKKDLLNLERDDFNDDIFLYIRNSSSNYCNNSSTYHIKKKNNKKICYCGINNISYAINW